MKSLNWATFSGDTYTGVGVPHLLSDIDVFILLQYAIQIGFAPQSFFDDYEGNEAAINDYLDLLTHRLIKQENTVSIPIGTIACYGAVIPPSGWLICDGSSVLKTDYPLLWDVLGDFWGAPTETTFVIPDYRNRSPMGYDNGSVPPLFAFGSYQGELEHTLTVTELPPHTHYTYATETGSEFSVITAAAANVDIADVDTNFKTYPTGGGVPHNTLHNVAVSAVIIFAGE